MRAGVGYSHRKDPGEAAEEATRQAIESSGPPALCVMFCTEGYDPEPLLEAVKRATGKPKVVGCCSAGAISDGRVRTRGVSIGTLSGEELRVATCLQPGLQEDPRRTGRRSGRELLSSGIDSGLVLALPHGSVTGLYGMTRGLYEAMGPDFAYTGGATGCNLRLIRAMQFTEQGVATGAVAAALVGGVSIGTAIGHGWRAQGSLMVVTRVEGNRVYELDGRPAFDVYSEQLGGIPANRFGEYGMAHPLGFPDVHGNYLIRDPQAVNEDKSIDFVSDVPGGGVANVMGADVPSLVEAARGAAQKAAGQVSRPWFALLFDCVSRRLLMGEHFEEELRAVNEVLAGIPVLGMLTFGEIGSYADAPLFHNKTTAVAVLGEETVGH